MFALRSPPQRGKASSGAKAGVFREGLLILEAIWTIWGVSLCKGHVLRMYSDSACLNLSKSLEQLITPDASEDIGLSGRGTEC